MKKSSVSDRMAVAEALLGKTTGASKGKTPPQKWKVKPKGNPFKGSIGFKATKKL
jgi:hypothetical protein